MSDDRPIRGSNILSSTGRSSYNLDFIDPENEWHRLPLDVATDDEGDFLMGEANEEETRLRGLAVEEYNNFIRDVSTGTLVCSLL